jgi:hypothetical protein
MIKKILTIILSVSVCCSCTSQNDEEMIRSLIRNGAELAEEKQIGDLMKLTGDGFTALPGSYDAVSVKGVLFRAFLHYGVFNILYPTPSVELRSQDGAASATVYFLIVRQNQDIPGLKELADDPVRWLETAARKADLYRLELQLKRTESRWLVYRAHLAGFKGTGF